MGRPLLIATAARLLLAGAVWPASNALTQQAVPEEPPSSERSLDPFEQKVREFLLNNPEVIVEAMQILQERQRAAEAENLKRAIAARRDDLLGDPDAPVGGNPSGDVTLVEFFDYNCPYCRRVAPTVVELEEADPDLRLVYKEFPILGPGSTFAARAALASRKQGKYLAFHNALMQAREQLAKDQVKKIAAAVGLDTDRLQEDMNDPAIEQTIQRNLDLANALGITGTPSFVIGDQVVPGAADLRTLQRMIAHARQSE